jgi:hypothetical protein
MFPQIRILSTSIKCSICCSGLPTVFGLGSLERLRVAFMSPLAPLAFVGPNLATLVLKVTASHLPEDVLLQLSRSARGLNELSVPF